MKWEKTDPELGVVDLMSSMLGQGRLIRRSRVHVKVPSAVEHSKEQLELAAAQGKW